MPSTHFSRADFLPELRDALARCSATETPPDRATLDRGAALVQAWRKATLLEDDARFSARLEPEGLDRETFGRLLAERERLAAMRTPPPDWHATLDAVLDRMETPAGATPDAEEDAPFAAAVDAFIAVGLEGVQAWLPSCDGQLDVDWAALAGQLRTQLRHALLYQCQPTLVLELNIARLEERLHGRTPEERFRHYTRTLLRQRSEWERIFHEHQGLARVMCATIERWRRALRELLDRLAADFPQLVSTMWGKKGRLRLTELAGNMGDAHKGGRSVWELGFVSIEGGREESLRVVYKPRSLAVDVHFQSLLAFCNEGAREIGVPLLKQLRVLDRGEYGWVEYAAREDCPDTEAAARFYVRQGAYLALIHWLDGVDLHHENLISAGEHPMLIDLETLFHPELFDGPEPEDAHTQALARLRLSVIRTMFLPRRAWRDRGGIGVNVGGLGNGETQWIEGVGAWVDKRTDTMHHAEERREILPGPNLPRIDGVVVPASEHTESLVAGFEATLRFLVSRRDALLAPDGPLMAFAGDSVRRVLRPTTTYGKLLIACRHPDYLRDLLEREQVLDHLWSASWERPSLRRIVPAEKEDLRLGDIPYFSTRPDSLDLQDSRGEVLKDFFQKTAMSSARARLLALDEHEIAAQVFMIRAALSASPTAKPLTPIASSVACAGHARTRTEDDGGIGISLAIGERLLDSAILGARDATWLGTTVAGDDELAFQVDPVGPDLYMGTGGIAMFLAYLGHLTKEERFSRLAERAARTTRAAIEKDAKRPSGGFLGVTSYLYVLSHLAALWNDPSVLPPLGPLLERVTATIPDDDSYDVIYGASGAILALLAIYDATGDERALVTAAAHGRHLADHAVHDAAGTSWTDRVSKRRLLGFSHGTSGAACALLRLARALSQHDVLHADAPIFAALGEDALRFERTHFDSEQGNWPDFRSDKKLFIRAWCHGAPGIALARLAAVPLESDEVARREVEIAVDGLLAAPAREDQSLCHGELGNLMIANDAAKVLKRPDWQERTRHRIGETVRQLRTTGPRCGLAFADAVPALMFGIAGIGYALLHFARPDEVPLVLALEPARTGRIS